MPITHDPALKENLAALLEQAEEIGARTHVIHDAVSAFLHYQTQTRTGEYIPVPPHRTLVLLMFESELPLH